MATSIRLAYMATCKNAANGVKHAIRRASASALQTRHRSESSGLDETSVQDLDSPSQQTQQNSEATQDTPDVSSTKKDESSTGNSADDKLFISPSLDLGQANRSYKRRGDTNSTPQSICFSQGFSWTQR